jgi:3-dehydroquinate synthetase
MRPARCKVHARFADVWSRLEESYGDRTWLIVADRNLLRRNARALQGLRRTRRKGLVELPGGEAAKRLGRIETLAAAARAVSLDREGLVVALGGGTIGDLSGFFASMWMRGVDWIPVATTTLSIADSAVGGKTAVDWRGLKNLLGHFHDPLEVFGVEEALASLPARHFRAGLVEVVKSAVIADARLFADLEADAEALRKGDSPRLLARLDDASRIKARIVARDPREHGVRAWLNFGHTVGHALESVHRPRLLHGEAVAAGMIAASWLSERLVGAPSGTTGRVEELLFRLGVLRALSPVDGSTLWDAMSSDKKTRRNQARIVLTPRIGKATVTELPPRPLLRQAIQQMHRRGAGRVKRNST